VSAIWDAGRWQARLDELCRAHRVPGASLAVLVDGKTHALATGVLNVGTGVAATTDSVFQIGSITKPYTTTLIMRLIDEGQLLLDTPVLDILPEFRLADPGAAKPITVRHLLTHTSGIDGDFFRDTGRGDDCLERYAAACRELCLIHPVGATPSYCNSGFVIAGRIIERLTGTSWDTALRQRLLEPLGVDRTVTLPEQTLRFRAAMGHEGEPPTLVSQWGLPRSIGPAGGIWATASDVIAFARLHLDEERLAAMRVPQLALPDGWSTMHRGLGWILYGWDGREVFGHDGGTIGQFSFLRVVPDRRVAVALLTNGGEADAMYLEVFSELLAELAELAVPRFTTPAEPPAVDLTPFEGTYRNLAREVRVESRDGQPWARVRYAGELFPESQQEIRLTPVTDTVFAGGGDHPNPWTFYRLDDGSPYLYLSERSLPKVD
jgi:CubicO group peptidase (beta-lactamase class C family)